MTVTKILSWSNFKDLVFDTLKLPVRYLYSSQGDGQDKAEQYNIFAGEENVEYRTFVENSGGSADTDFNEFVDDYKSLANVSPTTDQTARPSSMLADKDGRAFTGVVDDNKYRLDVDSYVYQKSYENSLK